MTSQRFRLMEWLKIYPIEYLKKGSFSYYVRKIFRKTNISYPLIHTCTYTYHGLRNFSFSGYFAYVLNE